MRQRDEHIEVKLRRAGKVTATQKWEKIGMGVNLNSTSVFRMARVVPYLTASCPCTCEKSCAVHTE